MKDKNNLSWFDNRIIELQNELSRLLKIKEKICPKREALKTVGIYAVLSILWVLFSNKLLSILFTDEATFRQVLTYKGWLFVFITSIIFYIIIENRMILFEKAIDRIFDGYEELSATNEELIAMEEELMNQYEQLGNHRDALATSDQRYKLVAEGSSDGIWEWDLINDIYFTSPRWKETLGYKKDEIDDTAEAWEKLFLPGDVEKYRKKIDEYLTSGEGVYENTYQVKAKDGKYIWVLSRGKAIWDSEGNPIRVAGSHTDITEQIELQETLEKEKQFSEGVINDAQMLIFMLDENGEIVLFNSFAETLTGYKKEEILGCNAIELLIPEPNRKFMYELFTKTLDEKYLRNKEVDILCKNNKPVKVLRNCNVMHDKEGNVQGVLFTGTDITERLELEKKLHKLAYYDVLTKLPNRAMFEEEGEKLIDKSKEKNEKMAFVYLDIDNFKHINDILGHEAGDKFIQHIGKILSENIKPPNIVSRLGGDEFGIILVNIKDINNVVERVNFILKNIKQPWTMQNHKFYITASMGVALYPKHGSNLSDLMQNADTAMFSVKDYGKDGYCIFTPQIKEKTLRHIEMCSLLKTAIDNEEFMLYYQPQVDLKNNKIIGVEALIRWNHPERGFIPPAEFITFAEETGHIEQIGQWVFKTACKQKREWEKSGYIGMKMSINLSGKRLSEGNLIDNTEKALSINDIIICKGMEVEITETAIMTDLEEAIRVLNELKQIGLTIALDDFGTGYSSLTYLQKLPIDVLKVDREFIKNIMNKNEDYYIFKAIIDLAHNLGLEVVAEGIETKEQLEVLIESGCDIGQGYYFSRPGPAWEIEKLFVNEQDEFDFDI